MVIRRRANAWQVVVWVGIDPTTGRERRIRRTVHGTKADARRVEAQLRTEVASGRLSGPKVTVGEFCDAWLERIRPDRSPSTINGYRGLLERYVRPRVGRMRLGRVTVATLEHLYGTLRREGGKGGRPLSPTTVRHVHALLKAAFGQAHRWGWIAANPAAAAEPPPAGHRRLTIPDSETIRLIIKEADRVSPDLADAVALGLTGMRRSELCALRWGDLDLDAGVARIERAVLQVRREITVGPPKTRSSIRSVVLPPFVVSRMVARRVRRVEVAAMFDADFDGDAFVLSEAPDGSEPLAPDNLTQRYARLVRRLGVRTRFHDLRHVASTVALATTTPLEAAGYVGHSRPSTTLDVYGHADAGGGQRIADALEVLFG